MSEDEQGRGESRAGLFGPMLRLLSFRIHEQEFVGLDRRHLALGLALTWLAGMGRYWDHPSAELAQYLGLGSLVYVFVLALILWLLIMPLRPQNWTYGRVLTFVTLTSPPALLYAIPVEHFTALETAQSINLWFLAVVASWRVALLLLFLRRVARLSWELAIVATMLPLALIVLSLAILNLEHVVFQIMAGVGETARSSNDAAYQLVVGLAMLSWVASPLLLLVYLMAIIGVRRSSASQPDSSGKR